MEKIGLDRGPVATGHGRGCYSMGLEIRSGAKERDSSHLVDCIRLGDCYAVDDICGRK